MTKIFMSGAILFLFSNPCFSQSSQSSTTTGASGPTEIGHTTMAPGQYTVIDDNGGKKYSLMVTNKGNMILGPAQQIGAAVQTGAPAAAAGAPAKSNLETMAEKEMGRFIQKQGTSQIKNLIK